MPSRRVFLNRLALAVPAAGLSQTAPVASAGCSSVNTRVSLDGHSTPHLKWGEPNTVRVRVDNSPQRAHAAARPFQRLGARWRHISSGEPVGDARGLHRARGWGRGAGSESERRYAADHAF